MHAAALCAWPGPGKCERPDSEHAGRSRRIGRKGEPERPRANDTKVRAEPARPTEELAVPIDFVPVLDKGRAEEVPRRGPGRHRHRAPVPRVAVIARMAVRHPPGDVVGQPHVAVMAARRGGHIDRLPSAVVCIGVCPIRVIAGTESPGPVEQRRCGAQRRWILAAAARQVDDHDRECHDRRDDDAGDQSCVVSYRSTSPPEVSTHASRNDLIGWHSPSFPERTLETTRSPQKVRKRRRIHDSDHCHLHAATATRRGSRRRRRSPRQSESRALHPRQAAPRRRLTRSARSDVNESARERSPRPLGGDPNARRRLVGRTSVVYECRHPDLDRRSDDEASTEER